MGAITDADSPRAAARAPTHRQPGFRHGLRAAGARDAARERAIWAQCDCHRGRLRSGASGAPPWPGCCTAAVAFALPRHARPACPTFNLIDMQSTVSLMKYFQPRQQHLSAHLLVIPVFLETFSFSARSLSYLGDKDVQAHDDARVHIHLWGLRDAGGIGLGCAHEQHTATTSNFAPPQPHTAAIARFRCWLAHAQRPGADTAASPSRLPPPPLRRAHGRTTTLSARAPWLPSTAKARAAASTGSASLFGRPCASCIPAPRPRAHTSLQSLSLITSSLFLWHAIIACVPGLRWRSPVSALGIWLPCQGTPLACFRCISVRHNAAGFLTAWRADFLGAVARLGQQQRRRTRARVPGLPAAVETAKQQVILFLLAGQRLALIPQYQREPQLHSLIVFS